MHEVLVQSEIINLETFLEEKQEELQKENDIKLEKDIVRNDNSSRKKNILAFIPETIEAISNFILSVRKQNVEKRQLKSRFIIKLSNRESITVPANWSPEEIEKMLEISKKHKIVTMKIEEDK